MRKLIFLALSFLMFIDAYTQSLRRENLKELLTYFDNCRSQIVLEEKLSRKFSSEILQRIVTKSYTGQLELQAVCRREYSFGTLLFFQFIYPDSEIYRLVGLLVYNNESYSSEEFGDNTYNFDETANASKTSMINDSLIQVIQSKYDFTFNEELERDYHYFLVNENGINQIPKGQYSDDRRFTESSERILDKEYLRKLSTCDLDIMRNEIFADHGYKFKSKKWRNYFNDKEWYIPRFDDVNEALTTIEKINIQLILIASNK